MDSISHLLKTGDKLMSEGKFNEAKIVYDSIVDNNDLYNEINQSALSLVLNNRGQAKYFSVEFNGAIEDYTKSLEMKKSCVTFYNRGLIHYRMGRYQESIFDFQKALFLNPCFEDTKIALKTAFADMKSMKI